MPIVPRYFLMEDGQRTGPHSLVVLRQKAEMGAFTPSVCLAPENEPDAWAPLSDSQVLCEELFPPRPRYTLAARVVEKVNTGSESHTAPSVQEMLRNNLAREREAGGELLKPLPPRSTRRRNDYLIVAGLINGLVIANLFLGRPWYDPFLLAFFVMGNISVAWILFAVMDRY